MKRGYRAEDVRRRLLREKGWFVSRVSGSIGPADLLLMKQDKTLNHINNFQVILEQVKQVTGKPKFYFNEDSMYELTRLLEIEEEFGIPTRFAFYLNKNNGRRIWKVFTSKVLMEYINKNGKRIDFNV